MFTKAFFDELHELRSEYFRTYPCGVFTLTIKAFGQEYNVVRLIKKGDSVLTFAFYDQRKSTELVPAAKEVSRQSKAWPAISIPYEAIESVEFNPGKAREDPKIGFETKEG
jgi:hypothetical protein